MNIAILKRAPADSVAMNRLVRAYEAIVSIGQVETVLREAVAIDPNNTIAVRRLRDLERRRGR